MSFLSSVTPKQTGTEHCVAPIHLATVKTTGALTAVAERFERSLVRLQAITTDYQAFPLSREYRVFIYQQRVLAYGFYWEEYTDAIALTTEEEKAILSLALEAARRVATPFIAVDTGQLESGEWMVIEVGDGQFSGLSRVPILELWSQLKEL